MYSFKVNAKWIHRGCTFLKVVHNLSASGESDKRDNMTAIDNTVAFFFSFWFNLQKHNKQTKMKTKPLIKKKKQVLTEERESGKKDHFVNN